MLFSASSLACLLACAPFVASYGGLAARTTGRWANAASAPRVSRSAVLVLSADPDPSKQLIVDGLSADPDPSEVIVDDAPAQQIESESTYGMMLTSLLKTNESISGQISANYALVDYGFLQRLDDAIAENDPEKADRLATIKDAVNNEMAERMQKAAEAMRDLIQSPTPVVMEGKIVGLARQGRLDDALLQLLQANLEQAQAAGEAGKNAVGVLSKLQERVRTENDAKLDPEAALLRRLLRMGDTDSRRALLKEKMAPKAGTSIQLAGMTKEQEEAAKSTEPDVSPRLMAKAIQEIKLRFGNVDENYDTGFVKQLEQIAAEAEEVALELAEGKEISARQAQDMMWEKGSVSVWDLEAVEEEAHQDGNFAMWEAEAQEQMARQDSAMRKSAFDQDWQ